MDKKFLEEYREEWTRIVEKQWRRKLLFRSFSAAFLGVFLCAAAFNIIGGGYFAVLAGSAATALCFHTLDQTEQYVRDLIAKRAKKTDKQ